MGDIQLETNIEYRFPIYGVFRGALFTDLGNIWLVVIILFIPEVYLIPEGFTRSLPSMQVWDSASILPISFFASMLPYPFSTQPGQEANTTFSLGQEYPLLSGILVLVIPSNNLLYG